MLNDQPVIDYVHKKSKKDKKYASPDLGNIREKAEAALERLNAQREAGTDGIENFEIKNGITIKL